MGKQWNLSSAVMRLLVWSCVVAGAAWAQPHWNSVRWNGLSTLAVKAFGKGSGLAVGYASGILKTGDGGATWNNVAMPTARQISSASFIDSANGWILGSDWDKYNVFRTADGGASWTQLIDGVRFMWNFQFTDSMHGWGVGYHTISKSSDGGKTWSNVAADTLAVYDAVYFVDANTGWIVRSDGKLVHTGDGGASFQVQDSSCKYLTNSMQFLNADTGWVGIGADSVQILRTTNGGKTWTRHRAGPSDGVGAFDFVDGRTGWFAPLDSGEIYKTTDGGVTWARQWTGPITKIHSIDFSDAEHGFATGDNGLIIHTSNGGTDWSVQTSIVPLLKDVKLVTDKIGWAVGYDKIVKTRNGGINWVPQSSGLAPSGGRYLNFVRFADTSLGWAAGDGVIMKTSDGGEHWRVVDTNSVLDLQFLDKKIGWAAGGPGLLKSVDGGETWSGVPLKGVMDYPKAVQFTTVDTGWVITGGGTVFKTTDGGGSWDNQNDESVNAVSLFFLDSQVGWAVGGANTLVKTPDGGKTWVSQWPPGKHQETYQAYFADEKHGWLASGNYVLATQDGGSSWSEEPIPKKTFVEAFSFLSPDHALAVGYESVLMRSTDPIAGILAPAKPWKNVSQSNRRVRIRLGSPFGAVVSGFDIQGRPAANPILKLR